MTALADPNETAGQSVSKMGGLADSVTPKARSSQFDTLNVFGVPMITSDYTAEDVIILIGKKKRPYHYSPIPGKLQDFLLDAEPEWGDRLMGIIRLKPGEESFIREDMTLQQIRGRSESLDKLTACIDMTTNSPDTNIKATQSRPESAQGKE